MHHAALTIDPAFRIADVDPRVYGSFVEHMGRCVYTGIYEPGHETADSDGFRGDVAALPPGLPNGEIVRVIDNRDRPLGRATWSERSQIALRFVRWEDEPVGEPFWTDHLEAAVAKSAHRSRARV